MIAEPLLSLAAPIDTVALYPGNPRRGDIPAIAESLRAFGQLKPLVVQDSTGWIIAGNHTLLAARQLGWTEIAVARVNVDDATARRFLVADNRIPYLGGTDSKELAAVLAAISADGNNFAGTGYDETDVRDALKALEELADDDEEPSGSSGGRPGVCNCCGQDL